MKNPIIYVFIFSHTDDFEISKSFKNACNSINFLCKYKQEEDKAFPIKKRQEFTDYPMKDW